MNILIKTKNNFSISNLDVYLEGYLNKFIKTGREYYFCGFFHPSFKSLKNHARSENLLTFKIASIFTKKSKSSLENNMKMKFP